NFELDDTLLPCTHVVVRIDGHGFHRLSKEHSFAKPNHDRALKLMYAAAVAVMNEFKDVVIAYSETEEYSFIFSNGCQLYKRRSAKICSLVVSLYTASYCVNLAEFLLGFTDEIVGRTVMSPTDRFESLLKPEAVMSSKDICLKYSLIVFGSTTPLFTHSTASITTGSQHWKGSVLYREDEMKVEQGRNGEPVTRHVGNIGDVFWTMNPNILSNI
ncbi:tRNAHis guanylyltransferase, partial [Cladochytrium replicatum]